MRLLFLQETDWLKRYPAQQHHLAEKLVLRGHEVLAIDYELSWRMNGSGGLYARRSVFKHVAKIYPDAGITVIRPGFIRLPLLDYISMLFSHRREIKKQIREFKPDAIIGFGILNSCSAVRLVKHTRIPFIFYWIDVLHLLIPDRSLRLLGEHFECYALKHADMALAINENLRETLVKMGAAPQKSFLLRAGIDTSRFDPAISGSRVRQQYGIRAADRVLFFMGFLYHFSGLKEVAQQIASLNNKCFKLLIVGEGDAYEELRAISERYNASDVIILAGKKSYQEIPEHIAAADVCLLPAYPHEPIMQDIVPIKLYEYMAMRKPVIATRLPGVIKEFGTDNGIIYIERPEDATGKAMELLDSGRMTELGEKARRFAERNSWDNITTDFENLLKEVIAQKDERLSQRV
jgi:glycosyltransferase involved in cell wall biosynthesis